jgi:hypothetical protein
VSCCELCNEHTCSAAEQLLVAACSLVRHVVGGAAVFVLRQATATAWYKLYFCVCCRQSNWTANVASCVAECLRLGTL